MAHKACRLGWKMLNWRAQNSIQTARRRFLYGLGGLPVSFPVFQFHRLYSSTKREYSEAELVELNQKATEAFAEKDFDRAIHLWEAVVQFKSHSKNSLILIGCLNNLACAYGGIGNSTRKMELLEQARQVVVQMHGTEHPQYGVALYHVACAKEEVGMYEDMRRLLEESLEVHEKRFGFKNIKVARVLLLLSNAHEHLGESEAQLAKAERAFEIVRQHYGEKQIQTAAAMMTLGRAYGRNSQPERYLQLVYRAFSMQENRLGAVNPQLALGLLELAKAHGANNDYVKQRQLLERAVSVQERALGEQPTYLVDTYLALGDMCAQLDEVASMAHYYNEALKIACHQDGVNPVATGRAASKAALGSLRLGNPQRARRLLAQAADLLPPAVSSTHPLSREIAEIKKMLATNEEESGMQGDEELGDGSPR